MNCTLSSLLQGNSSRNNSPPLKRNTFESELRVNGEGFWIFLQILILAEMPLAVVTLWGWSIVTDHDDRAHRIATIGFILVYPLFPVICFLVLDALSVPLLPLFVKEKVLRGEEEEMGIEAPTWFPTIPAAGCCFFLLLSGFLTWVTNSSMLNLAFCIVKLKPTTEADDGGFPVGCWKLTLWPILGCCGMNVSLILALILAYAAMLIIRAKTEASNFQVSDKPAERKLGLKVLEATSWRAVQLSLLLCHRLIPSSSSNYQTKT